MYNGFTTIFKNGTKHWMSCDKRLCSLTLSGANQPTISGAKTDIYSDKAETNISAIYYNSSVLTSLQGRNISPKNWHKT